MDYQPRSGVPAKKKRRDWLIALVMRHPEWAIGFLDETWWSRFAQPHVRVWSEVDRVVRLVEQVRAAADTDPKALACYGMLVRWPVADGQIDEQTWLRFVDGRPVSNVTVQFLEWSCAKLEAMGRPVLALIWDNASWHISREVRTWIHAHNCQVKRAGQGVRILACRLPVKSPWLNPIEPKWAHGKRRVMEPDRTLSVQELADRVCAAFGCDHEPHLSISQEVA